ncbi:hypothetical protein DY000_02022924 [Brassica cretica]|uniref:Uncharacterized protein n=1 Tax=Brassica cretica TaxID=69181 RepID=A0ABQ7ED44_BRACR|nr:hypothetical protein DY000_02022924 [Brassica cretica]
MVSQIVWLGVRDVFTQIARDVVGQGLDHSTLTFKAKFAGVIHANMADSRRKRFSAVGESCLELLMECYQSLFHYDLVAERFRFYERILMTHSFLERIGRPEVDLATIELKAYLYARCYIYSRGFSVTNVFDAFP